MRYIRMFTGITATAVLLLVLNATKVNAELATLEETELVSQNWLAYITHEKGTWSGEINPQIVDVQEIIENDTLLGYYYSVSPKGYVVVPILKELSPVKASSESCQLDVNAEGGFAKLLREMLLDGIRAFIKHYGSLDAAQPTTGEVPFGLEHRAKWDRYTISTEEFSISLSEGKRSSLTETGPLLTTSWHQSNPYYNYCPIGDGGRCVVGCVATAAAQIMKYHNWPPFGVDTVAYYWMGDESCGGSTPGMYLTAHLSDEYDWENIPDHASTTAPQEQKDAVAELNYEVGVAYSMMYGRCGSGAYVFSGQTVFPEYFRYKEPVLRIDRPGRTAQEWYDLAAMEINALRPIAYRITRHAIVLDGCRVADDLNQFHFNYGWHDSHNAWYTVDYLYCPWEGCSNADQMMIYNIVPDKAISFTVDTTVDWLPIEVQFTGSSDLEVDSWTYDFGDGDSAFIQSPTHIFDTPGRFDVTLEIQAGEINRSIERPKLIIAIADTIAAPDVGVAPDSSVEVVIYARNSAPVTEMRIPVVFYGDVNLTLDTFMTEGCRTDYFEIVQQIHLNPGYQATFKLQCTNSASAPELAPGVGPILKLLFSAPAQAVPGQSNPLDLSGYSSFQPMFYGSVIDYQPDINSGTILCASCCTGIRGNVDGDELDEITISDLIYLINYMFNEGPELTCWKEADVNASLEIEISDLIHLVNYMFNEGYPPLSCP
ncbi:MAG: C10 family peptidase [candidate division Zixibacteria bacterium]|nr:C10 family peptidase [candidate division Zixibacteria bacterium]